MKTSLVFAGILAVLLISAAQLFARLDETRAQCDARYGKPVSTNHQNGSFFDELAVYIKDGLSIKVQFHKGRAGFVRYQKKEGEKFINEEIETLLNANNPDKTGLLINSFLQIGSTGDGLYWAKRDGTSAQLIRYIDPAQEAITFHSAEFNNYAEKEIAAKRAKPLNGF